MKILIAGLGSIGRRHLRNLLALGERDIVLYRTRRAVSNPDPLFAEIESGTFPVETDLQSALAHRPAAVIIANPTALHLDVALPAAAAGCHLLLEKPISHSLERIDQLESAAARSGSRILVGFQFRFHPTLQRLEQLLTPHGDDLSLPAPSSSVGRPLSVRAQWGEYLPDWYPWEDYRQGYAARPDLGGGVLLTLCHPFDYLRWLFGEYEIASSLVSNLGLGLPVEDTAEVTLRFASGLLGSLHLDYLQRPPQHTLSIVTTQGAVRWDNADGALQLYSVSQRQWLPSISPSPDFERNTMFLDQMRHFLAVCRGQAEPLCTLQDGRRALELALAARRLAA